MNNEDFEPIPEIVENKEEDIEVLNIDENTPVTEENIIDINRLFETDEDIKIEKEMFFHLYTIQYDQYELLEAY